jgi:hypothetical protein
MLRAGFERTIPVFEWLKTVRAVDRAAIGTLGPAEGLYDCNYSKASSTDIHNEFHFSKSALNIYVYASYAENILRR